MAGRKHYKRPKGPGRPAAAGGRKTQAPVRLDREMRSALLRIAAEEDRSLSAIIRLACQQFVARRMIDRSFAGGEQAHLQRSAENPSEAVAV